jgi:hypothetical protein
MKKGCEKGGTFASRKQEQWESCHHHQPAHKQAHPPTHASVHTHTHTHTSTHPLTHQRIHIPRIHPPAAHLAALSTRLWHADGRKTRLFVEGHGEFKRWDKLVVRRQKADTLVPQHDRDEVHLCVCVCARAHMHRARGVGGCEKGEAGIRFSEHSKLTHATTATNTITCRTQHAVSTT